MLATQPFDTPASADLFESANPRLHVPTPVSSRSLCVYVVALACLKIRKHSSS